MSPGHDITAESARLDAIFRGKARAEIEAAERVGGVVPVVRAAGDELAEVLLVKGEPGPGDIEGGYALAGPDGDAANRALDALGQSPARFAFCTRAEGIGEDDRAERIRLLVEALDPAVVLVLDPLAAHDLAAATGMQPLEAGVLQIWRGRAVLSVDGLEASLADEDLKRRVWRQLKALASGDDS